MQSTKYESFLSLVRLGIGHHNDGIPKELDWRFIQTLAERQGLYAVVLDGIERLPSEKRPPQELLLEWIGEVLQSFEYRCDAYKNTIAELAGYYNSHGYKMMVLKGYACSLNWPKPEHRPCGDIDIWQFGDYKKADEAISRKRGIKVDNSHHHHTVFNWGEFMVENHYDFVNVYDYSSSKELEVIFKELGKDDTHFIKICGEKVYLPSPNLHALFLLRHTISHFASTNINLRQVLDWGFFVERHTKEVDWEWVLDILEKYHMREFYNCICAICIEDLGFDAIIFPEFKCKLAIKEKVLDDILSPKYGTKKIENVFGRLLYKFVRWHGNAWKQDMCYEESRWSAFWKGILYHLLKPKSI